MIIKEFSTQHGRYSFELENLQTLWHSHPAAEIIVSQRGSFQVELRSESYQNMMMAIIPPNVEHRIQFNNSLVELMLIECNSAAFNWWMEQLNIYQSSPVYTLLHPEEANTMFEKIKNISGKKEGHYFGDLRISKALQILKEEDISYQEVIPRLRSSLHLSESRISHLFKEHTGISIKKYFVWSRLCHAIHHVTLHPSNLTQVSHLYGFYDQSHLSNAFKSFLGINPVFAYNSRTLQVYQNKRP